MRREGKGGRPVAKVLLELVCVFGSGTARRDRMWCARRERHACRKEAEGGRVDVRAGKGAGDAAGGSVNADDGASGEGETGVVRAVVEC